MHTFTTRRLTAALLIIGIGLWFTCFRNGDGSWVTSGKSPADPDALLDSRVRNSTLGFQKIFAIGFKERTDKHDAITLAASYTGLEVDWLEGVRAANIPPKAYPAVWTEEKHRDKPAELGSWRAHMNALRYIVESKISSAVLMEDDSDWDVNIKTQMVEFARGTRALQGTDGIPFSPYGDSWDMLWLGHCGINSRGDPKFYVIPNDLTVTPRPHQNEFVRPGLAEDPNFESHRLVFSADNAICSWAMAFTYEGARKALTALSYVGIDEPVDLGYNFLCTNILHVPYQCLSSHPSIMGTWAQRGPASRDSDITDGDDTWHEASSRSLTYSTMLNILPLANNKTTISATWDDVPAPKIDITTFKIPRGYLYTPDPA
ncbi:LPS glycosyltransferase [Aspergillus nomiae NRRL 13137]|uniref:LPS glycosyltransferase n=1 Tax=Aspergillus nomiae NRRL (strain ATCC 15546 / NRRL 13137 / CBS 260.88 / M93) TaxID=1509407 RepID=A0A0L1JHZ4_ASPN3|nr:LPS glycosyltransferase [Aspergillus nomiae NRRL 13137]KNG91381.1 LPS glycosyltransferase [Aspergillus nomiae NRRL 13137]